MSSDICIYAPESGAGSAGSRELPLFFYLWYNVNRLLVLPLQENFTAYDFHIESAEDAKTAAAAHGTFFCLFRLTG